MISSSDHSGLKISVIMSVKNAETYLRTAIESILKQSFDDFEFIIINDGSTDKTASIINSFQDKRIINIRHHKTIGLPRSLNEGIKLARGTYIARMDADDIALPNRLKFQYDFMETHPKIGLSGSWVELMEDLKGKIWRYPVTHNKIAASFLFFNPFAHPTVIFRKKLFEKYKLTYNKSFLKSQDYELWSRAVKYFPCANIPQVLLQYRVSRQKISHDIGHQEYPAKFRKQYLKKVFTNLVSDIECFIHEAICQENLKAIELKAVKNWLNKLIRLNKEVGYFPEIEFKKIIALQWYQIILARPTLSIKFLPTIFSWNLFTNLPIQKKFHFTLFTIVKLHKSLH